MAKICELGSAKAGIVDYLVATKAIAKNGRILSFPQLRESHKTLKEFLNQRFGIDREIIFDNAQAIAVQFNEDSLYEIDALYGFNYSENRKYWRDYEKDSTLTPEQLVGKYVKISDMRPGIQVKKAADFTFEEANKLTIGINSIFPDVEVKVEKKAAIGGQQRYAIKLGAKEVNIPEAVPTDSPLMPDQEYAVKDMVVVDKIMQPLLSKMKNVSYEWVTSKELEQKLMYEHKVKPLVVRGGKPVAVAVGKNVYLVKGRVDGKIALEELMHIFVDGLITKRPALYKGLLNQAMQDYPAIVAQVNIEYSDENRFDQEYRNAEIVTRALRDAYIQERIARPEGISQSGFLQLAKRFWQWLIDTLGSIFSIDSLPLDTTIDQLAVFLNVNELQLPESNTLGVRYNIADSSDAVNDEYDDDTVFANKAQETGKDIKNLKLESIRKQVNILAKAKAAAKGNPKMIETINTLIQVTQGYRKIVNNDTLTISASKFTGQPDLPKEIQEQLNPSQNYGRFIHGFMEYIMLKALEEKETIAWLYTGVPEIFDDYYENNKNLLTLPGLDKDIIKKDLADLVSSVNDYYTQGFIVIPEITIYGTDNNNKNVISRLDFLVIKPSGKVTVGDFKTTKLNEATNKYADRTLYKTFRNKKLIKGVHPAFSGLIERSKVIGFISQLGVYDRSLRQHGIISEDNNIINIVYSPFEGEEEWTYKNMYIRKLNVTGENGIGLGRDEKGVVTGVPTAGYSQVLRALSASIPLDGETTAEKTIEAETNKIKESIDKLSDQTVDILLSNIKSLIDKQLESINVEYKNAEEKRADLSKLDQLRQRKRLLQDAKNYYEKATSIDNATILVATLDRVFQLVNSTKLEAQRIAESETNAKDKIEKLSIKNKQFTDFLSFLGTFRSVIKNSNVPEGSQVMAIVDESIREIEEGQKPYLQAAKEKFIEVLMRVPKRNADRMIESMAQLLQPRKAKLEAIVNGDASVLKRGGFWLGGKIRGLINSVKGVETTKSITQDMKEAAQDELNKINYFLKFPEYTRELVELYVENTFTNPESGFYIGSTIKSGYSGLNVDDFRSSFGNSELAITALANYGISMTDAGQQEFWNQMEKLQIDQKVKSFSNKYGGYENLNKLLSEVVTITNFKTNETDNYLSFVHPIARSFFDTHDKLDYAILVVSEQIDAVRKDTTLTDEQRKQKIAELSKLKKEKRLELQNWLLKETNTKLKPEVYKLQVQLPDDIQDEINKIEDSIAALKAKSTVGDWNLPDSIISEIQQYELHISQLRRKAIDESPDLQDVFDKLDTYYEYTVNEGLYSYIENKMKQQYGEKSLELERWYELNSELIPSEAWYNRRNELLQKLKDLSPGSTELDDLYQQRRDLISKYTFKSDYSKRSIFDPSYMTDEDAIKLDDVEAAINDFYEKRKGGDFVYSKEYKKVKNELNKMQQETAKPRYSRDFDYKLDNLTRLYEKAKIETDATHKQHLEQQFTDAEVAFKKWYDRNNTEIYTLGSIKDGDIPGKLPKNYNVIKIPTDPAQMIRVPSSKYRTRHYKAEAYNPLYSPTLEKRTYGRGSYPMPKGISYNNETKNFDVDLKSNWVNPKYTAITKDSTLKGFYDELVIGQYYNKQIEMSANKLGFFYPSVRQIAFDTIAQDGVKGMRREWNEGVDSLLYKQSNYEQATNEYGIAGENRVKFAYNYAPVGKPALPESLVTKDGINAIIKWRLQYEINQKMEEANLAMSPMVDYLKGMLDSIPKDQPVVRQQVEKVISIFEFERDKFIYGKQFNSTGKENEYLNRRTLRMFLTAASWARLAFDPAMQAGNLVSGNVQAFLAVNMKKYGRGTYEDYLWAKNEIYGSGKFVYKLIADWGEVSGVGLETKIMRYFNPLTKTQERALDVTSRGKMRRLLNRGFNIKDIAFILQDKGEIEIAMTTLLKNLHAYKFKVYETDGNGQIKTDTNGNPIFKKDANGDFVEVTAFEALENGPDATPAIRKDVAMTYQDLEGIKIEVQNEYIRHQGNYSPLTMAPAESGFIGILMFFFRKYLVGALEIRFKGAFGIGDPKNWIAGEAQIGWWTAFFQTIGGFGVRQTFKSMLPGFVVDRIGGSEIPLLLRNKIFQARNETVIATLALILYVQLREMVYPGDDEDDKELNWAQMQALRTAAKVANESRSLVPFPVFGKLEDYIKNFATYTTALNEFITYTNAIEHGISYILYNIFDSEFFYDNAFYLKSNGRYEKGDAKYIKDLAKISSVENIQDLFDPQFSIKELYKKKD